MVGTMGFLYWIILSYHITVVTANQTSTVSTIAQINSTRSDDDATDSSNRLQSYWDIRDSLASKPNRAPLVVDNAGHLKVEVSISLGVGGVITVNDALQTVTMSVILRVWWTDPSLAWNPADYHDVNSIELTTDQLWIPDMFVINSFEVFRISDVLETALVDHNGNAFARFPFNVEILCSMDLSHFPYDTQRCSINVASYSKLVSWKIVSDPFAVQMGAMYLSTAWVTEDVTVYLQNIPEYREVLPTVKLKLKRRTAVFTVCLVLPMVLTSYMNTLVFLLPPDSGEKMSFLVTLFVSTSLFVSFFKEEMPRGLNTLPSIMKLLVFVLAESIIFLFVSILILRRHHQERECPAPHKEPALFQKHAIHPSNAFCSKRNDGTENKNERSGQEQLATAPSAGRQAKSSGANKAVIITAQRLDLICFFLAFVTNTLALIILLFSSL